MAKLVCRKISYTAKSHFNRKKNISMWIWNVSSWFHESSNHHCL